MAKKNLSVSVEGGDLWERIAGVDGIRHQIEQVLNNLTDDDLLMLCDELARASVPARLEMRRRLEAARSYNAVSVQQRMPVQRVASVVGQVQQQEFSPDIQKRLNAALAISRVQHDRIRQGVAGTAKSHPRKKVR